MAGGLVGFAHVLGLALVAARAVLGVARSQGPRCAWGSHSTWARAVLGAALCLGSHDACCLRVLVLALCFVFFFALAGDRAALHMFLCFVVPFMQLHIFAYMALFCGPFVQNLE